MTNQIFIINFILIIKKSVEKIYKLLSKFKYCFYKILYKCVNKKTNQNSGNFLNSEIVV